MLLNFSKQKELASLGVLTTVITCLARMWAKMYIMPLLPEQSGISEML